MPDDYSSLLSGAGALIGGPVGAGIGGVVGGLVSGITGIFQRREAKKALKNLQYPTMSIPNEVLQNQKAAQLQANVGLPSAQYNQAMQNVQRNQNNALAAASDRRGALGLIGATQQQANDATLGLDVANAKARMANQRQLIDVNNQVGAYRQKAWDWNYKNKYQQAYNYNMGLLGAGNQNLTSGVDKFASGALLASGLFGSGRRTAAGATGGQQRDITTPTFEY